MSPRSRTLNPGARIFAIVGPTAVGKTAVALALAESLGAEIISVDSMQVYRGMDIGTSKAGPAERSEVVFHMVDVADPTDEFSVALFKELADGAASRILEGGKLPLLVGGSGLYYRAVVDDLDFSNTSGTGLLLPVASGMIRDELEEMSDGELHALLSLADPSAAGSIPFSNRRRVQKALEVAVSGNRLISDRQASWSDYSSPYDLSVVGLEMDRPLLYRVIDERVDEMLAAGLEGEVERLRAAGLRRGTTAGEALGYRQLLDRLDGRLTLEEAIADIKTRTRNYAKRQLTWFRKDPRVEWFPVEGDRDSSAGELARARGEAAARILEYLSDKLEN
jgi:tRNA dimethylallyltransferase